MLFWNRSEILFRCLVTWHSEDNISPWEGRKGYFFSCGGRTTFSAFLSKFVLLLFMPLRKHSWNWNNYLQSTLHFATNYLPKWGGGRESFAFEWQFTVKGGQAYTYDTIKELIIWKMNPSVVPVTSVKFKSALLSMRNEQWIFYENFAAFGQIENLWMDKIASKTFTSN